MAQLTDFWPLSDSAISGFTGLPREATARPNVSLFSKFQWAYYKSQKLIRKLRLACHNVPVSLVFKDGLYGSAVFGRAGVEGKRPERRDWWTKHVRLADSPKIFSVKKLVHDLRAQKVKTSHSREPGRERRRERRCWEHAYFKGRDRAIIDSDQH